MFDEHPGVSFVGLMIFTITLVFVLGYFISKYDCLQLEKQTGYKTEYHLFGVGCGLQINGKLIPREIWINNTGN